MVLTLEDREFFERHPEAKRRYNRSRVFIAALMFAIGMALVLSAKSCSLTAFAAETVVTADTASAAETGAAADKTAIAAAVEVQLPAQPLNVKEVWLTGDTLHISVIDRNTGVNQTLELTLSDYATPSDELVTIQAVDREGNKSNVIQFKNPYYKPTAESSANVGAGNPEITTNVGESAVVVGVTPNGGNPQDGATANNGAKPFTPDGTGAVLDNVTENDGKEFFSITTEDGNVFYLIVDRQRSGDNVYLLNAVNEDDLASLAKTGNGLGGGSVSAIQTGEQQQQPAATATPQEAASAATATETAGTATSEPTAEPPASEPSAKSGGNLPTIAFIVIAALAVGGVGYYFKIVRPKKNAADSDDSDFEDDSDDDDGDEDDFDDEEIEVAGDGEGGGKV